MANRVSEEAVLGSEDLLGKILLLLGSSKELIRASLVSPHWRAVTKGAAFRSSFVERHDAAHVGFLVEMQEGPGRIMKLLYAHEDGETEVAIRRSIHPAVLAGDVVLSSRQGLILTIRGNERYCTSFPGDAPRMFKDVAPIIPDLDRHGGQYTINTYGQFGLVDNAGRSGMGFFVKDASRTFLTCYDGVSFCSAEKIFVHVCVHNEEVGWERFVSNPYQFDEAALFHRNPYCVLVGTKMYLMYLVGFIVCFDRSSKLFSDVALPTEIEGKVSSWYDYTVASHRGGGLVLVHYYKGNLYSWVLSFINDEVNWTLETMVDLVQSFGDRITPVGWERVLGREAFPIGSDHFFSMQVRKTSHDGRFVLLTLGFDLGMFEVDMVKGTVKEISNEVRTGLLGRMFVLSEQWPPMP